jgi:FkbM family methyltransferase
MLVKSIKAVLQSGYQFRQLHEMPAALAMPRKVTLASIARMNFIADRYLPNPVQLLGYNVSYADAAQLRYLYREIFVLGAYIFHSSERYPFIVDCGSNIGISILFFKRLYPGAKIIGFEPDQDTFAILQRNIEQNGLSDVTVHNCALTDYDGTIAFYQSGQTKSSLMMSTLQERASGTRTEVPARRLSNFLTTDVDLLKMDIEGAETSVLPELAAANALRRVRQLHLEYHHHIQRDVDDLSVTLQLLEQHGFGYQLQGTSPGWGAGRTNQYIAIYAYQKAPDGVDDRSTDSRGAREARMSPSGSLSDDRSREDQEAPM